MQGKIYEIPLDISDGVLTSQIRELVTEDMGTNTFRFKVVRDKHIPYDFTDTTVRMMVKTPSGARIQQECTIENAVSGTVSLTLKQSLLLEHGSYIAELQIYDAITQSIRLTTPTFDYHVRQSLQNSESIIATDEYTILQEALADLAGINIVVANKADKSDVGDIEELETDEKANLVQAINEVKSQSNEIATDVDSLNGKVIVESGSNVNGNYSKFGDGVMICFNNNILLDYSSDSLLQTSWIYPALFVANPAVISNKHSSLIYNNTDAKKQAVISSDNKVNNSTIRLNVTGSTSFSTGDTFPALAIAIGRWK